MNRNIKNKISAAGDGACLVESILRFRARTPRRATFGAHEMLLVATVTFGA